MDIVVRAATPEDADAISRLNRDIQALHAQALPHRFKPPGPDTFPPLYVRALLARRRALFFLAEEDGSATPAGYVYAEFTGRPETSTSFAERHVYVHHIGVATPFRRRGVGAALLDAVRDASKVYGITTLVLDTWSFNEEARRFFRGYGLAPVSERLWLR
jgi:ribosomal protein S18 acetylase RimI-like enzyme